MKTSLNRKLVTLAAVCFTTSSLAGAQRHTRRLVAPALHDRCPQPKSAARRPSPSILRSPQPDDSRTGCATTFGRTGSRRSAPSCGWSSTPARCSRTTTSGAWRISSSTWPSTAPSTSRSTTWSRSSSRSACASGPTSTRHQLRRDGLQLQVPTDTAGVIDKALRHPGGLGPRRDVRSDRGRQGARRRPRGVAAGPRRRARMFDKQLPICSRARATPNGCRSARPRSSRTFPPRRLRRFYTDWYRPT